MDNVTRDDATGHVHTFQVAEKEKSVVRLLVMILATSGRDPADLALTATPQLFGQQEYASRREQN